MKSSHTLLEGDDVLDRRIRLIERICRLPEAHLTSVEELLDEIEKPPAVTGRSVFPATSSAPAHKDWPHAPVHRLSETGTYIVTASTHERQHFFRGAERLTLLESALLRLAREFGIVLEAWAVFSNHYHFLCHTAGAGNRIAEMLSKLHTSTATELNLLDGLSERQVWFNYWDTRLTYEKSYLSRLNYVHQNAVKHGLVGRADEYPWCSAAWFQRTATPAQIKTIYSFKTDRIKIEDDYEPVM